MKSKWIKKDKRWSYYPIGTRAKQDDSDEVWEKVDMCWQSKLNGAMFNYPPYCDKIMLPKDKPK